MIQHKQRSTGKEMSVRLGYRNRDGKKIVEVQTPDEERLRMKTKTEIKRKTVSKLEKAWRTHNSENGQRAQKKAKCQDLSCRPAVRFSTTRRTTAHTPNPTNSTYEGNAENESGSKISAADEVVSG